VEVKVLCSSSEELLEKLGAWQMPVVARPLQKRCRTNKELPNQTPPQHPHIAC
jgi:hypothetical protein